MQKYEYKIIEACGEIAEEFFNKLGNDGWELVGVKSLDPIKYIFKREKL